MIEDILGVAADLAIDVASDIVLDHVFHKCKAKSHESKLENLSKLNQLVEREIFLERRNTWRSLSFLITLKETRFRER